MSLPLLTRAAEALRLQLSRYLFFDAGGDRLADFDPKYPSVDLLADCSPPGLECHCGERLYHLGQPGLFVLVPWTLDPEWGERPGVGRQLSRKDAETWLVEHGQSWLVALGLPGAEDPSRQRATDVPATPTHPESPTRKQRSEEMERPALTFMLDNPNATMREIAQAVGCSTGFLSSRQRIQTALKARKGELPWGSVDAEGRLEAEA